MNSDQEEGGAAQTNPDDDERKRPLRTLVAQIDHANKLLLERVRTSTQRVMASPAIRRWGPVLLLIVLFVYLMLGAAAFFFFEHTLHETSIRKFYMSLAISRRHFARSISSRIFNDTQSLLIIIDKIQSDRVQQLLVDSLKSYENRVNMQVPDKTEWTLLYSVNYAYALLLTLGNAAKVPESIGGQVFSLIYAAFGIPLLLGTIAIFVRQIIFPCFQKGLTTPRGRKLVPQLALLLYIVWVVVISLFLYFYVSKNYWTALYTAVFCAFTVQLNNYPTLHPVANLVLLILVTVSLAILMLIAFILCDCHARCHEKKQAVSEGDGPQRFTVVVNESGESQLAK